MEIINSLKFTGTKWWINYEDLQCNCVCSSLKHWTAAHLPWREPLHNSALWKPSNLMCFILSFPYTHFFIYRMLRWSTNRRERPLGSACVLEIRHVDRATEPSARPFCRREAGYMTILREPLYKGCHLTLSSCGAFTPHRVRREWVFTRLSPSSSALVSLALPLLLRCLVFQLTSVGSVVLRRRVSREQAGTLWEIERKSHLRFNCGSHHTVLPRAVLLCHVAPGLDRFIQHCRGETRQRSEVQVSVCVAEVALLTYWCWIQF